MAYVPLRKAVEKLGLHPNTLRRYADEGKIQIIKNEAGQRLYNVEAYIRTQKPKSSKTSAVDLTSKEKDCVPYWTDFCKEISSRLLLPVETDYVDSGSSLYSTWSNKTVAKSWFKTKLYTVRKPNSQAIFSASSTSSLVECTDLENTVRKSKKIKICLSPTQRNLIKRWIGTSRFVFNETEFYICKDSSSLLTWAYS